MFVAAHKKKTNIAEYILYMWQIEALIRSCDLNIFALEDAVISSYKVSGKEQLEVKEWYKKLIAEMKKQGIQKSGHLKELREIIGELLMLHNMLINLFKDKKYLELYAYASPNIDVLLTKSATTELNEIEVCLNGLYGKMSLKMNNKTISQETEEALQTFSNLLAFLTVKYHEMKEGKFSLPEDVRN